LTKPVTSQLF